VSHERGIRDAVDVTGERTLDEPRNAFSDERTDERGIERLSPELFEHRIRRHGEVGNRIEQRAIEVYRDRLHGERKADRHFALVARASCPRIAAIVTS
jgi:hypothetical protein